MNILFVCSRNQWRSPTAEKIFQGYLTHHYRSAGTSESARIKISAKLLEWADMVFVMEKKHKEQLISRYGPVAREKEILVLDIPDDYGFMDEELIEMLETAVTPFLGSNFMDNIKSSEFLTYKELTIAVDSDNSYCNFKTAAEFLLQAITDWPTLNLLEPEELIKEIRNEVHSKLTFDNLEVFLDQLNYEEDGAWKRSSLLSLLELFDFERNNSPDKKVELETIVRKLTEYYRQ